MQNAIHKTAWQAVRLFPPMLSAHLRQWYTLRLARVAELVDAHGSGPCIARCGDSSSLPGTKDTQTVTANVKVNTKSHWMFQIFSGFLLREVYRKSERNGHQIVPLNADNAGLRKFTHLECFTDFFGRQQLHHAIDLGRVGIRPANAAFTPQRRG